MIKKERIQVVVDFDLEYDDKSAFARDSAIAYAVRVNSDASAATSPGWKLKQVKRTLRRRTVRKDMATRLLMHAVDPVLQACGNSYANSYTQVWLEEAQKLGAYSGSNTGRILDLREAWDDYLNKHRLPILTGVK